MNKISISLIPIPLFEKCKRIFKIFSLEIENLLIEELKDYCKLFLNINKNTLNKIALRIKLWEN